MWMASVSCIAFWAKDMAKEQSTLPADKLVQVRPGLHRTMQLCIVCARSLYRALH